MLTRFAVLVCLLLVRLITLSQTSVIAFRSHSGNMRYFNALLTPDNLGLPPMTLDSIIWLSDTSVVEITSMGNNWHKQVDTVIHHPYCNNPNIGYDSLKTYYPFYTVFVGFDTTAEKKDTVQKSVPVADTLVRPKEKIKSRKDTFDQSVLPVNSGPGNDSSPTSLITYFTAGLGLFLIPLGLLIWLTNRKKIIAG